MERIIITIDDESGPKRVNVRRNLHIRSLIDEVRNKRNLLQGNYILRLKDSSDALDPGRTLEQHGIDEGAELVFVEEVEHRSEAQLMIEAGVRKSINDGDQVYLQEEREGLAFEIGWKPAIIGRADQQNPAKNKLLAVDLTDLRGSEYASRHHACISETKGEYTVESLNSRNPTYINNQKLSHGQQHVLQPGDKIQVGRIGLVFNQRG